MVAGTSKADAMPDTTSRPPTWKVLVLATRPNTLAASFTPVLVGFAVASRDVDAALRQPDERAAVLAHLGTAEVRAAASLEHAALTEATRAWRPVGSNRRRHNIVIDNDAREVAARCAEVASLLRRHPRATCRVEAHAGADLQPPVLAFALATARARLVRDRIVAAFARLGLNERRVELASMRPRAPATRVEVYLRLRDHGIEVEVPARPTDGAPPHALTRLVPRVWRRRRAWPRPRARTTTTAAGASSPGSTRTPRASTRAPSRRPRCASGSTRATSTTTCPCARATPATSCRSAASSRRRRTRSSRSRSCPRRPSPRAWRRRPSPSPRRRRRRPSRRRRRPRPAARSRGCGAAATSPRPIPSRRGTSPSRTGRTRRTRWAATASARPSPSAASRPSAARRSSPRPRGPSSRRPRRPTRTRSR